MGFIILVSVNSGSLLDHAICGISIAVVGHIAGACVRSKSCTCKHQNRNAELLGCLDLRAHAEADAGRNDPQFITGSQCLDSQLHAERTLVLVIIVQELRVVEVRSNWLTATDCSEGAGVLGELQIVDQLVCGEDRICADRTEGAADVNFLAGGCVFLLVLYGRYFLSVDIGFGLICRHKNSRVHTGRWTYSVAIVSTAHRV